MYKYILTLSFLFTILFSGCSYFTFNWAMCDKIASDPNRVMPQECRNYNEEEAQKAFDQTKHKSSSTEEDKLEFKE